MQTEKSTKLLVLKWLKEIASSDNDNNNNSHFIFVKILVDHCCTHQQNSLEVMGSDPALKKFLV